MGATLACERCLNHVLQCSANTATDDFSETAAYSEMTTEATKYLGGDIDHTHLVKGLDYALLVKVRDEMEKMEDEKLEA